MPCSVTLAVKTTLRTLQSINRALADSIDMSLHPDNCVPKININNTLTMCSVYERCSMCMKDMGIGHGVTEWVKCNMPSLLTK